LNKNIYSKIKATSFLCIVLFSLFLFGSVYPGTRVNIRPEQKLVQKLDSLCKRYDRYIQNKDYAVLIDYDLPIFLKRLWVINVNTGEPALTAHVSHARRSGTFYPHKFSNIPESRISSKGVFVSRNSYEGKYGLGMRIQGLEKTRNDNVLKRAIVFHPVTNSWWSDGCFMTDRGINRNIIEMTKGGSLIYVHSHGNIYRSLSKTFAYLF
jgi:hypothetical protein